MCFSRVLPAVVLLSAASGAWANVMVVKNINPDGDSFASQLFTFNGKLYFTADDGVHGTEIWTSDGTSQGTQLFSDFRPGAASSGAANFSVVNGELYFSAFPGSFVGQKVYKTNGTTIDFVADVNPSLPTGGFFGAPQPGLFRALNSSTVVFRATGPNGQEVYRTDGTPEGTSLVKDIHPGATDSIPTGMMVVNGVAYFGADDKFTPDPDGDGSTGTFDRELWRTDGTAAGTYRVKDINPGPGTSFAFPQAVYNNEVYLTASDGVNGQQLWKTDGTEAGTVRLTSVAGFVDHVTPVAGKLFFTAFDSPTGSELYVTDGTPEGTRMVKDINPDGDSYVFSPVEYKGKVFFTAETAAAGRELWFTDGTESGTQMLTEIIDGPTSSGIDSLTVVGDLLFFVSIINNPDFTVKTQLWATDGTELGTSLVFEEPGLSFGYAISNLTALGDTLFFTAPTGVDEFGYSIDVELHSFTVPEPSALALAFPAFALMGRRRKR